MELSKEGQNLIKGFESCDLYPYKDVGGLWTIGWGHLLTKDEIGNQLLEWLNHGITQDQADAFLITDTKRFVDSINKLFTHLTQNQFDALVSLAYNIGISGLAKSCIPDLVRAGTIDARLEKVWRSHCKYKKNGLLLESKGLIRRRKEEWELFSKE